MARRFEVMDPNMREYRRYNVVGRQLTVCLIPSSDTTNPVAYFLASVKDFIEHALRDIYDSDMVGITIRNNVNQNDKTIGISFRWKDQLCADVVWSVFKKASQSNSRFNALDTLVLTVHSVKMTVSFSKNVFRSGGRSFSVMAQHKSGIVAVKAEENCLAHALVIALAKAENNPNYDAFRKGRKIRQVVQTLLEITGINLSNGAGIPELVRFPEQFQVYKIVVYRG